MARGDGRGGRRDAAVDAGRVGGEVGVGEIAGRERRARPLQRRLARLHRGLERLRHGGEPAVRVGRGAGGEEGRHVREEEARRKIARARGGGRRRVGIADYDAEIRGRRRGGVRDGAIARCARARALRLVQVRLRQPRGRGSGGESAGARAWTSRWRETARARSPRTAARARRAWASPAPVTARNSSTAASVKSGGGGGRAAPPRARGGIRRARAVAGCAAGNGTTRGSRSRCRLVQEINSSRGKSPV